MNETEKKMIPGQEPYTNEQKRRRNLLIASACRAQEFFDLDELEEFTKHDYLERGDR